MAILRSHGVLLVDSIPTHTPTAEQATLARLEDTLTFYYYDGAAWQTIDLSDAGQVDSIVSGQGITVDNTDPANPIIDLGGTVDESVSIAIDDSLGNGVVLGITATGDSGQTLEVELGADDLGFETSDSAGANGGGFTASQGSGSLFGYANTSGNDKSGAFNIEGADERATIFYEDSTVGVKTEISLYSDELRIVTPNVNGATATVGQVLALDNTSGSVEFIPIPSAPVTDVFGRTGNVVAAASDYDDSQIDLTYSPTNFTATNAFVDGALEGLDNAFGALVGDGNDTPIIRGNTIQGVAPTSGEIPSPVSGDTGSVYLSDGVLEKWVYTTSWSLAYTLPAPAGTNLGYTASATDGTVTSDTGSDATIPLVDSTDAGLMSPGDKDKIDFITITQAVDLDAVEAAASTAVQPGDLATVATTGDYTDLINTPSAIVAGVVSGQGITVDNTDAANPIVNLGGDIAVGSTGDVDELDLNLLFTDLNVNLDDESSFFVNNSVGSPLLSIADGVLAASNITIANIDAEGAKAIITKEYADANYADAAEPTAYISRAAAILAEGAGVKFQYLAANLDGAVEGTVAWT